MKAIKFNTSTTELISIMSEGNPGGLRILMEIMQRESDLMNPKPSIDSIPAFMHILNMDDMNIRGSDIWIGYKDFAKEDLDLFLIAIKNRDIELVSMINQYCQHNEKVVVFGGSKNR